MSGSKDEPILFTKVRAGFYRVGALCIHKGRYWCVYRGPDPLTNGRFRTLTEAVRWAHYHQPKATGEAA